MGDENAIGVNLNFLILLNRLKPDSAYTFRTMSTEIHVIGSPHRETLPVPSEGARPPAGAVDAQAILSNRL